MRSSDPSVHQDGRMVKHRPRNSSQTTRRTQKLLARSRREYRTVQVDCDGAIETVDIRRICHVCRSSELRNAMLCIEMLEVTYLYGYLLVSARVYTSDSTPTSCRSCARNRIRVQQRQQFQAHHQEAYRNTSLQHCRNRISYSSGRTGSPQH
jgi:hypothetical protein